MDTESNKDIGWRYGRLENTLNRNNIICAFCDKVTRGGIYRHKQHLAHVGHNVAKCQKVPDEVKELVRNYMQQKKSITSYRDSSSNELYLDDDDTMRDSDEFGNEISYGKGLSTPSTNSNSAQSRKRSAIESFFRKEQSASAQRKGKLKQTTIDDRVKKDKREETCQYIARWFYQAGIPFNVARLPSFQKMIEEIGEFGKGMKAPSYHELRVPLLKKEIGYTENLLKSHKEEWVKSGCSIMSDGWTDRKDRTLINFLVNSPQGSVFMESIDASSYSKTGERLFELLDGFVEKVGEKNVVQVITDNASAYVLAEISMAIKAQRFLKKVGLGKEDYFFWKHVGKGLLCTYALFGAAWLWNETSPLGWWTLKPRPKEEKEMAHLYERRKFPYPGDKEAVDEFLASGGALGTTIGPKGIIETGKDSDNFQKKLQSKKFEQESLKMWIRMRNEVISDLQEKGYDIE